MAKLAAASSRVHIVSHSSCGNTRTSLTDWKQALHLIMSRAIRSCQNVFAIDKNRREGKSQQGYIFPKKGIFRLFSATCSWVLLQPEHQEEKPQVPPSALKQKLWPEIPELGSIVTWRCWESPLIFLYTSTYRYRDTYRISIPPNGCLPSNVIWCAVIGMCHLLTLEPMDDSRTLLGPLRVSLFELNHM